MFFSMCVCVCVCGGGGQGGGVRGWGGGGVVHLMCINTHVLLHKLLNKL